MRDFFAEEIKETSKRDFFADEKSEGKEKSSEEEGKTKLPSQTPDVVAAVKGKKATEFDLNNVHPMAKLYVGQVRAFTPEGLEGGKQGVKNQLSGATLGMSELIPGMKPEKPKDDNDATMQAANRFMGSLLPWGAFEKYIVDPVAGAAAWNVAKHTMSIMKPILAKIATKMTVRGVGMPAINALERWARSEEVPSKKELVENGALIAAVSGALDTFTEIGIPLHQVLKHMSTRSSWVGQNKGLWDAYKAYGKMLKAKGYSFFKGEGRPVTPQAMKEVGIEFAENRGYPIEELKAIEVKPVEPVKPKISEKLIVPPKIEKRLKESYPTISAVEKALITSGSNSVIHIEKRLKESYPTLKDASVEMYANKDISDVSIVVKDKNKDIYFMGNGKSQKESAEDLITKIEKSIPKPELVKAPIKAVEIDRNRLGTPGIWKDENIAKDVIKTKENAEKLLSQFEDQRYDAETAIIKSGGRSKALMRDIIKAKDAKDAIEMINKIKVQLPNEIKTKTVEPVKPIVEPTKPIEKIYNNKSLAFTNGKAGNTVSELKRASQEIYDFILGKSKSKSIELYKKYNLGNSKNYKIITDAVIDFKTDIDTDLNNIKQEEKPTEPASPEEKVVNSTFVPDKLKSLYNATINIAKKLGKSQSEIGQLGWNAVAKWYGDKNYAKWVSVQKWDKASKEFTKAEKEDMLYYREHTGNPFKAGDDFTALSKRLSSKAKEFIDNVVDKHFEEGLKLLNNAKYIKPINPREIVRNIFVPHFYEGKDIDKKIIEAYRKLGKKFNTKNPFENKRLFMTFDEAFKEAGLKPKYTNIIDMVRAYDGIVSRVISNNELIGSIKEFEAKNDLKVIIRKTPKTAENYADALIEGWIPFNDPSLRTYYDGTSWKVSDAPALIHPDLAESMTGVFQKKAKDFAPSIFKSIGTYYDAISAGLRNIAVNLSGFHFVALGESAVGATKWKTLTTSLPTWWKKGGELLTDPKIMEPALKAGLKIDYGAEQSQEFMEKHLNRLNDWLRTKQWKFNPSRAFEKAFLDPYIAYQNFLWKTFHPRLKINTWYQYRQDFLNEAAKNGETITPDEMKKVEAQIAEQVNNIFGGQVWELQKYFNDPDVRKWMYRLVGFPDWSISAIKQAQEGLRGLPSGEGTGSIGPNLGFKEGFRGKKGRAYWSKYAAAYLLFQNFINYMTTGHSTFENEDPKHRLDFALPEVKITFKGKKYNLGRDEKGRKYYSHFGKQMLEIGHYFTNTIPQLFNKSNPLFQLITKQVVSYTPSKDGGFPVQGKFKNGEFKPWGAEKGFGQVKYRGKEILETIQPFSIRGFIQHPGASVLTLGSLPVTKGLSLYDAKKYLEKEFKKDNPNVDEIDKIKKVLYDGGYTNKQITRVIKTTRTLVQKEKNLKNK